MLWEHEPQVSVSTAFSSSPKLSRVFLELDRNTDNMFSTARASSVFLSSYRNTVLNQSACIFALGYFLMYNIICS